MKCIECGGKTQQEDPRSDRGYAWRVVRRCIKVLQMIT